MANQLVTGRVGWRERETTPSRTFWTFQILSLFFFVWREHCPRRACYHFDRCAAFAVVSRLQACSAGTRIACSCYFPCERFGSRPLMSENTTISHQASPASETRNVVFSRFPC